MPKSRYHAVFTGVNTQPSAFHEFEADAGLLDAKTHDVLVTAPASIETPSFAEHHDHEIHAVSSNQLRNVVTRIGYLVSGNGDVRFAFRVSKA